MLLTVSDHCGCAARQTNLFIGSLHASVGKETLEYSTRLGFLLPWWTRCGDAFEMSTQMGQCPHFNYNLIDYNVKYNRTLEKDSKSNHLLAMKIVTSDSF